VLFPFLFFSGAFFPLDGLPLWLEALGIANPLSYAVDMLQLALYAEDSSRHFGLAIDFAVLVILAAGLVAAGAGRQIEPER
jgi:ABC-2 type transport system permease protein